MVSPVMSPTLQLTKHRLSLSRPLVLGVLNVTPDSFSDGGQFATTAAAVARAHAMHAEGADIIDVGGESTRPGAPAVSEDVELSRVLSVVQTLSRDGLVVSIDSTKAAVVREALAHGAAMVNDVGTGDSLTVLGSLAARAGAGYLRMHSRATPSTMQSHTTYPRGVMREVTERLKVDAEQLVALGVAKSSIVLDPGIGFAKRAEDSLQVLAETAQLVKLGFAVCVGPSRKSFIAAKEAYDLSWNLPATIDPAERVGGTAAAVTAAILAGALMIRVHDVSIMAQAARVAHAIASRRGVAHA